MKNSCKVAGALSCRIQKQRRRRRKPNQCILNAVATIVPINKTVVDLGAGVGLYVKPLLEHGFNVTGFDGTEGIEKTTNGMVEWLDLTGDCSELYGKFDWGLFIEVGEHVPKTHESRLIQQVSSIPRKGLIISWGLPKQRGRGHVNCLPRNTVIRLFVNYGWRLSVEIHGLIEKTLDAKTKRRLIVLTK